MCVFMYCLFVSQPQQLKPKHKNTLKADKKSSEKRYIQIMHCTHIANVIIMRMFIVCDSQLTSEYRFNQSFYKSTLDSLLGTLVFFRNLGFNDVPNFSSFKQEHFIDFDFIPKIQHHLVYNRLT